MAVVLMISIAIQVFAEPSVTNVLNNLDKNKKLRTLDTNELCIIIRDSKTIDDRYTAKVLLMYQLADRAAELTKDEQIFMKKLTQELSTEASGSWQGQLAKFNGIAFLGFEGKYDEQIKAIRKALEEMDFDNLENEQAVGFKTLRKTIGDRPHLFKELLKLMLNYALCNQQRIDEAENIKNSITDMDFAKMAEANIQYARNVESIRQKRKTIEQK